MSDAAMYAKVRAGRRKGYAQLITNRGQFALQLHCDIAPFACDNFLRLADQGRFDKTVFHRLVPNLMMQGGADGPSIFGGSFRDEFDSRLRHDGPGILSMANSGATDDNKAQFFITFTKAAHLDNKHTIFGKIVGGLNEFLRLNITPTDPSDRPIEPITIERVLVVEDPFRALLAAEEAAETQARTDRENSVFIKAARSDPMASHPNRLSMKIGKYIDWTAVGV